jgi:heme-degrading monooxygenase HmoA
MYVEVFRFRVNPSFQGEFEQLYASMVTHIKGLNGYMSHKVFTADDGETVVVGYFETFESVEAWDKHPEHKHAKERGKADIFIEYDVVVAQVVEHHAKKPT